MSVKYRIPFHWHYLLLLLVWVMLACLWPLRVPITEVDEARYTAAVREMVTQGDYLIPHFNAQPRYQKPILYYWLQAASVRLFGVNEVAARFPSAVAVLLTALLVYGFLLHVFRRTPCDARRERTYALCGALATLTMPLLAIWSRSAVTDPALTLFTAGAMLALVQADLDRQRRWYLVAALCTGLAFLTKGPIGLVAPALAWVSYHLTRRQLRDEVRRVPWLAALGVLLAVAAPWYILTYFVDGPGFLTRFFLTENLERYTTAMEGHGWSNRLLGFFTFPVSALVFCFPFSAFLLRDLIAPTAGQMLPDEVRRIRRFAWIWVIVPIAFFSTSATQLPSYIQGIAPAVAVLFALHLAYRETGASTPAMQRRVRWGRRVEAVALVVLTAAWSGGLLFLWLPAVTAEVAPTLARVVAALLGLTGLALLLGIGTALIRRSDQLVPWTTAGWTAHMLVILLGVLPLYVCSQYHPVQRAGEWLHGYAREQAVFTYLPEGFMRTHTHPESLVYYAQRPVQFFTQGDLNFPGALQQAIDAGGALVVTDATGRDSLTAMTRATVVGQFGKIAILHVQPD